MRDRLLSSATSSIVYVAVTEPMGFGPEDFREFVLNGIDGSWLDDPTKRRWRREWSREIDALIALNMMG